MNMDINNTKKLSFVKCCCNDCVLESFEHKNTCILHCNKDNWDEKNDILFWKEIRLIKQIEPDFFMFSNIIFPSLPTSSLFFKQGFSDNDYILKEDYLFWNAGQKRSFGNLAQFTNCIFHNFHFHYVVSQTIKFCNCTVNDTLDLGSTYIEDIYICDNHQINHLKINTNRLNHLELKDSNIEKLEIQNIKTDSMILHSLNIQTAIFNNVSIQKGLFQNLTIENIEDNATIFLDDIKKFFYQNVTVKKADREYFRFLKKIFTEKDDFINVNDMYKFEMESYFRELLQNLKKRKNISNTIQNLLVVGFAKYTSTFGESWIRPFLYLVGVSFLNVYYTNVYPLSYLFSGSGELWKHIFQSIYFFDKDTLSPLKVIFNVFQSLLIYQLVVSIKRKIKY